MATFIAEIVAMPTARRAIKDKDGNVIGQEQRTRISVEPRFADDDALVDTLFGIMGQSVKVTIVLEQPELGIGKGD